MLWWARVDCSRGREENGCGECWMASNMCGGEERREPNVSGYLHLDDGYVSQNKAF